MKRVHVWALVGLVIGATLFGGSDADAVLCVKTKKGVVARVTIRDAACKRNESVGDASVLLGLPTTTFPPTTTTLPPSTRRPSRIVDSAGNAVAWAATPALPTPGLWALRTIDDGAIMFPMNSNGPIAVNARIGVGDVVDDFQNEFWHQGQSCEGDRFSTGPPDVVSLALGYADLVKVVYPSTDGKTAYLKTFEPITVTTGIVSQDHLAYQCAAPPDPVPPNVTCGDDIPPFPGVVVTPVGSAFPCDPNKLEGPGSDPTLQCTCRRCCVTTAAPSDGSLTGLRVKTVDLGLGNSTPPFRVEP